MLKLLFVGGLTDRGIGDAFMRYDSILVGDTTNTEDALRYIDRYDVDCIAVLLSPPTGPIYDFISTAGALKRKPVIIAVNGLGEDAYARRALQLGASVVLNKGASTVEILEKARLLCTETELTVKITKDGKTIDERLAGIFIQAGIPPHIKGYQFLREAVKCAMSRPEMINSITRELYPSVARKYNTSSSKVERAIRHAIDVAWSRGRIENINQLYGVKIFSKGEKPTNGELIALISDKMIIECAM